MSFEMYVSKLDLSSNGTICAGPGGMIGRMNSSIIHSSESYRLVSKSAAARYAAVELVRRFSRDVPVATLYQQKDKLAIALLEAFPVYISYAARSKRDDYRRVASDTACESYARVWAGRVLRQMEMKIRADAKAKGMLPPSTCGIAVSILCHVSETMDPLPFYVAASVLSAIRSEAEKFVL